MNTQTHNYYFYDLNEVLIDRYPAKIAKSLLEIDKKSHFIFLFSEKYFDGIPKNLPRNSEVIYSKGLKKEELQKIIEKFPPTAYISIAQRIPDMWLLSFFNSMGVETFIVQHGLWSDKLERVALPILLLNKFSKFFDYLRYAAYTSKLQKISYFAYLRELYLFLLKETVPILELPLLNSDKLRAKHVFAFDESWKSYYVDKYGYNEKALIYIGNPDYLLLKGKNLKEKEDAVCYLCQSLVEDGRFYQKNYQQFLMLLDEVAKHKKLYIKLHQRSRIEYYDLLKNNKNIVFTNDLPICKYYIGHYTGLLSTVYHISENILIWKFPNHHVPEYFLRFGSIVTNKKEDLLNFINGNYKKNNSNKVERLPSSFFDNYDPIKTMADSIYRFTGSKTDIKNGSKMNTESRS